MRLWIGLVAIAIAALVASGLRNVQPDDDGYFYRVKVDLTHKGEPIDLNVVVNCRTRITRHRDGSSASVEDFGSWPVHYAMAIKDGHAVAIDAIGFCDGKTTDNGKVAKNWLPLIAWYDKAEDLSFGLGYWSQDAYEGPRSQLEFHGATVTKASRKEFEDFIDHGPPNLLPDHMVHSLGLPPPKMPEDLTPFVKEPWRAWPYSDWAICQGVLRVPLTPRQKDLIRPRWPADHPRFWSIPGEEHFAIRDQFYYGVKTPGGQQARYMGVLNNNMQPYDFSPDGHEHLTYIDEAATKETVAMFRPQVFPVRIDMGLSKFSSTVRKKNDGEMELDVGDGIANRGIVYCERLVPGSLPTIMLGKDPKRAPALWGNIRNPSCLLNGMPMIPVRFLPGDIRGCWNQGAITFENDEYAIVQSILVNF